MNNAFVDVKDIIPDMVADIRYAGCNNFTARPVNGYFAPRAYLAREAAEALGDAAADFRKMGYRLWIFDAYRPQRAVDDFIFWARDADDTRAKAAFYPDIADKARLFELGYIAKRSAHSRGSAVDLTLCDADGTQPDMGGTFDLFGALSRVDFPGLTQAQRDNRALLARVMTAHGFAPYSEEWWHFRLKNEPYPDMYFDEPIV